MNPQQQVLLLQIEFLLNVSDGENSEIAYVLPLFGCVVRELFKTNNDSCQSSLLQNQIHLLSP